MQPLRSCIQKKTYLFPPRQCMEPAACHIAPFLEEVSHKQTFCNPHRCRGKTFYAVHQHSFNWLTGMHVEKQLCMSSPIPCSSTPATAVTAPQHLAESVTAGCAAAWILFPISLIIVSTCAGMAPGRDITKQDTGQGEEILQPQC